MWAAVKSRKDRLGADPRLAERHNSGGLRPDTRPRFHHLWVCSALPVGTGAAPQVGPFALILQQSVQQRLQGHDVVGHPLDRGVKHALVKLSGG